MTIQVLGQLERLERLDKLATQELIDQDFKSTPATTIDGQSEAGFDSLKIMEWLGV